MKDNLIIVIVMLIVAIIASNINTYSVAYADGYCAGMGGARITNSVCNINGKVVDIP